MSADFYSRPLAEQLRCSQELAISAVEHWGLSCKNLRLIKARENAVYELQTNEGRQFALRIHRANYHSDAALHSELQWMFALQEAGVAVPVVVPCKNGDLFARVSHAEIPEQRQLDLFEWIDGEPLGSSEDGLGDNTEDIDRIYSTIGRIAAQLHLQANSWEKPKGFTRHAWDADGLVGEQPLWGRFWELDSLSPAQRDLLVRARDAVKEGLAACDTSAASYGLIHADFVPENLMVDEGNIRLIDFDDAGFGWHMFEIATALYFIQDDPNYERAKSALIDAYREHKEMSDQMLARLPLFMLARSFTYVGWVHTRPGTETAIEMTPMLVEMSCKLADDYLTN